MLNPTARRLAVAVGATAAALLTLSPLAGAEPPNCTSADLEGVRAGVDASTSAYLFTHPDLNTFMGTLQGLSREQVAEKVKGYMASHPQENAEMTGIRQPLMDLKNHCGGADAP
ncbi:heme-binding protein [Mycobacterium sp. B14F4]|uniref:heme-binding protein n=1 Tax=Mycobacterium sp. B14F4 TaxID=3153565 RepID=UPI00325D899C